MYIIFPSPAWQHSQTERQSCLWWADPRKYGVQIFLTPLVTSKISISDHLKFQGNKKATPADTLGVPPKISRLVWLYGSGRRIRTLTYRVRVCCATLTQSRCVAGASQRRCYYTQKAGTCQYFSQIFFTEYGAYFSRQMAEGLHGSGGQSRRSVKKTGEKGSRSSPFFPVLCAFYPSNSFQKIYITQANNTIYNALFTSSTGLSTGIRPDTSGIFPLFHAVFHILFPAFARSPPGSRFT